MYIFSSQLYFKLVFFQVSIHYNFINILIKEINVEKCYLYVVHGSLYFEYDICSYAVIDEDKNNFVVKSVLKFNCFGAC